jgi:Ca2+:H+ antiporter
MSEADAQSTKSDAATKTARFASKEPSDSARADFQSKRDSRLSDKRRQTVKSHFKGVVLEKEKEDDGGLSEIIYHPMNVLLVCLPLGVVAYCRSWGDLYVFWLNFFAMVPLAKILGDITEELAASLKNDILAGLLNATFGNAVEMVITVQTMRANLFNVVKESLLGSVLSNVLLVLGMSFLCGGLSCCSKSSKDSGTGSTGYAGYDAMELKGGAAEQEGKIQTFGVLGALVNTSMLLISCMSFSLVTVFRFQATEHTDELLIPVSRISSIMIMCAYVAYVFFQLVTHKDAMADGDDEDAEGDKAESMAVWKCVTLLAIVTTIVAFCSELLVGAIEGVTEKAHLSQHFIGIVLLPIVGNACEHAAAVRFAIQDKLGLSVSIAVGSSTQIALFVVPFSVLVGWATDKPMDLDFGVFNTTLITLSVVVVLSMVVDGQSNWLQGYLLCTVYCIIAVMYWYLPVDD